MSKGTLFMFLVIVLVIFGVGLFGFGPQESFVPVPNETPTSTPPANETVKPRTSTSSMEAPEVSTSTESSACIKTGCSNQVCSDQEVVTDCMYREEYICYQKATCERQDDGQCGWTLTPEVEACLLQYE